MVFNSYASKEEEFNALRNYRLGKELEGAIDLAKQAMISKKIYRSKIPAAGTTMSRGDVSRALNQLDILLHKVMTPSDARRAFDWLNSNAGIAEAFYNERDSFLKFFEGVRNIPYESFVQYWSQPHGPDAELAAARNAAEQKELLQKHIEQQGLLLNQFALASLPPSVGEGESVEGEKGVTGLLTSSGETDDIKYSDAIKHADEVLDDSGRLVAEIKACKNTSELKDIRKDINDVRAAIIGLRMTPNLSIPKKDSLTKDTFLDDRAKLVEVAQNLISELKDDLDQAKLAEAATQQMSAGLPRSGRLGPRLPAIKNRYHPVGEKFINTHRLLKSGYLSMYHPSKRLVGSSIQLSPNLIGLIKDITFEDRFDPRAHKELTKDERNIFDHFMETTRLNCDPKYKMHNVQDTEAELEQEYKKLVGELTVGNNNRKIRADLKKVIAEMYKRDMISDADFKRALETIF